MTSILHCQGWVSENVLDRRKDSRARGTAARGGASCDEEWREEDAAHAQGHVELLWPHGNPCRVRGSAGHWFSVLFSRQGIPVLDILNTVDG